MARKNNIRSIRFSDELAELIDRQVGNTFTEKFEGLITRCVWELPQKEKELEQIKKMIEEEERKLDELVKLTCKIRRTVQSIEIAVIKESIEWKNVTQPPIRSE